MYADSFPLCHSKLDHGAVSLHTAGLMSSMGRPDLCKVKMMYMYKCQYLPNP